MEHAEVPSITAVLPGGSSGSHVTLRPFSTGEMGVPAGFMERIDQPLGKARALWRGLRKDFDHWTPCPIFFVQHPTAGNVLIDTGLPPGIVHDVKAAVGPAAARAYGLRATEDQPLPARLRQLGIPRSGIDVVVMTHLHVDHAGALSEIEDCVVVVSKSEWKSAHGKKPLARGYLRRQFDTAHDFRLIDFDADSVNSFASFARSFDLFGDGSVILVSTPGHSHGHMSVVLRLKDRECLITGDAIYQQNSLNENVLPLIIADEHNYNRSLKEIRAYTQQTPSALVIPGHDPEFFANLKAEY